MMNFTNFHKAIKQRKKTYDTLTVRIEDADWYFDRKKWQAGVFSGYVDVVHLESLNQYGIYREDNTLVGCPNSFDFDDEIKEFAEGQRVYCIFLLVPHIDSKTSCIDIKGKAVLIKFFEGKRTMPVNYLKILELDLPKMLFLITRNSWKRKKS